MNVLARVVQISVGFAISAVAIVVLVRSVPLEDVAQRLAHAQAGPIVLIVVCVMGSLVTRAGRWQVYFLPKRRVPFSPLLAILAISYMASTFLPLRAGELVRPVFLGLRERIPVTGVVGTILLEKLFDFLAIGVMLSFLITRPSLPDAAHYGGFFISSVILIGFGFVVSLAVWRTPTLSLVRLIEGITPLGVGKRLHFEEAARHFAEGTDALREPRLWALLLSWTAVTWFFALGSTLAGMLALDFKPPVEAVLLVVVATSSIQAVPSSPGYVGVYHLAVTEALAAFGVDRSTGFGIALVTHAFSYGSLVIVGLIALWTGGYTFGDVLKGVRARSAVSTATAPAEL